MEAKKKIRHLQNITVNNGEISGWLEKQSRHLKQWRERYVVLKDTIITTYKTHSKIKATENIKLDSFTILNITPENNFQIKNESINESIILRSANDITTDRWLSFIEQRIKKIQEIVIQECIDERDKNINGV